MNVSSTTLPNVLVIEPTRHSDARGFFAETWNRRALSMAGLEIDFVQDNHSVSTRAGTVRGLHFQMPPRAQAKLVRCGRGALRDVVLDLRVGSPTYGRSFAVDLTADNGRQLFVPEGLAHGFVTLRDDTEICYKCSDFYAPDAEAAVNFADPALDVDWGVEPAAAHVSPKDRAAPKLADFDSPFVFAEGRA